MNIYKNQNLLTAFELYVQQQNALLPDEDELKDVTFSDGFAVRMRQTFSRRKRGYYVLFGTAARRVASIVVALLVSATIVTASVEALRRPVVEFFTEIFQKFTRVSFVDDTPTPPAEELVFEPRKPSYVPDGYVMIKEEDLSVMYRLTYKDMATGNTIRCTQRWKESELLQIDTEGVEYTEINIGNYKGIVYDQKGKTILAFGSEKYVYTLSASINSEELIKIAESIEIS